MNIELRGPVASWLALTPRTGKRLANVKYLLITRAVIEVIQLRGDRLAPEYLIATTGNTHRAMA